MRLYHSTDAADVILATGFRDGPTSLWDGQGKRYGVWLADRIMTAEDFAVGNEVLTVEIPGDVASPFEQPDDGLPLPPGMPYYRAFLIPAEVVNRYPVEVLADESEDKS